MITLESLISTVCLDVLNVILICYFYSNYQEKNISKINMLILAIVYFLLDFFVVGQKSKIILDFFMCFYLGVFYKVPLKNRVTNTIFMILINSICEFITYTIIMSIFNSNALIIGFSLNDALTVFKIVVSKYMSYIMVQLFLVQKYKINQMNMKIFKYISFWVSIFYGLTILIFFREVLFYHETVGRIFIFTLVLYNTVLVIFNYYQNMHIRTVNKLETLKQNRSYQGKYWKDYYENYAAIRKTKHDMLNGYIGLYGLVKEERYDELKLYLESSIKNLKEMESVHYFGNPLIDAIVSKKISDAKERGIEVVFHCGVISIGDIDEEDLGILLANALDNAIESTVKSSYDKIDVYVSTMNCFLKIDVINYVDDITGVSFKNTSKVFDKENHGIGIKSMKDTAKKYNGSLQYDKKDNEVILSVIMNIN